MKKDELKVQLESGAKMSELFAFSEGQECTIFKATNFMAGNEVIYIPDLSLNDIPMDKTIKDAEELEDVLACCYTGQDFLDECGGDETLAERLFWYCDWQHPSSAYPEVCDEDPNIACIPGNDGLQNILPLRNRDEKLEKLWAALGDIPMDPETECLEDSFMGWRVGTHREEIWKWFDERYSMGVVGLLYPGTDAREANVLYKMKQACRECDAEHCAFNPNGICMFPMVGSRAPNLHDDGCADFCYQERKNNDDGPIMAER